MERSRIIDWTGFESSDEKSIPSLDRPMAAMGFLMPLSLAWGRATPLPMPVVACASRARTALVASVAFLLTMLPAETRASITSMMA